MALPEAIVLSVAILAGAAVAIYTTMFRQIKRWT